MMTAAVVVMVMMTDSGGRISREARAPPMQSGPHSVPDSKSVSSIHSRSQRMVSGTVVGASPVPPDVAAGKREELSGSGRGTVWERSEDSSWDSLQSLRTVEE